MERLHNPKIQGIIRKGKHIERKYHIIRDIVARGNVVVAKIESTNNLADPFTKALSQRTFESHLEGMGVKLVHNSLLGKWKIVRISALKSYCMMLCMLLCMTLCMA